MPAGTAIIGRVAVKVLPDTSDFKRKAQAELDAIEKRLELEVPTKIDMSGASRQYLEEVKKINARNQASDARKIRFYTMISTDGMRQATANAKRKLQALADAQGNIKFKADVDVNNITQNNAVQVKLDLDKQSLHDVKDKIDHWRRQNDPVKITVKLDWGTISSNEIKARLTLLTRPRKVSIIPTLNEGAVARVATALAALSGARILKESFEGLNNFFRNIDKSIPKISAMALAFGGISASVLASSSNILAFSSSLVSIAPAALALPGILGGMAVGIGITVAAFRDFNKELPGVKAQLSQLQNIISANFWDKLQKPMQSMIDTLFPILQKNVASTATALGSFFAGLSDGIKGTLANELTSMFADLNKSIQIATGGTGAFVGIITTLGSVGAGYLPRLAAWFVDISTKFDNFLTKAASDGRLQGWIDTGITALKDLGRIIAGVSSTFASLARAAEAAGGSTFSIMADTVERIANAAKQPAFQTGLTDAFMGAHAAFNLLATNSGPAVEALFSRLGALFAQLLPSIGATIGNLLSSVASALASPAVSNGIIAMFNGISMAVDALGPAIQQLSGPLGAVGQLIGTMAASFGPVLAAAIGAVAPAFTSVTNSLAPLIQMLSGALTGALTALGPHITNLGDGLSKLFSTGLTTAIGNIVHALLPPLTAAFGALADAVGKVSSVMSDHSNILTGVLAAALVVVTINLAGMAAAWVAATAASVASSIAQAASIVALIAKYVMLAPTAIGVAAVTVQAWVTQAAAAVASGAATAVQVAIRIGEWIAMGAAAVANAAIVVAGWVASAAAAVAAGVAYVVQGAIIVGQWVIMGIAALAGAAQVALAWLIAMGPIALVVAAVIALVVVIVMNFDKIKQWIGAAWDWVKQKTSEAWDAIKTAISTVISAIATVIKTYVEIYKAVISAAWNVISSAASAAWNAIKSVVSSGISAVSSAVSSGMSAVKSFFSSAWDSLKGIVSGAWNAISGAVSSGISSMMGFIRGIPGQISGALGNLGGLLTGAGSAIIDGLISGIKSGIEKVKGLLNSVTGMIPDWKGPLPLDKVLLFGAGQAIMGGFVDGLESKYDSVRKSLQGLTSEVGNTTIDSPDFDAVTGRISSRVLASVNGGGAPAQKVFNYYAAPGASLGSQEELFAASDRARMVGW